MNHFRSFLFLSLNLVGAPLRAVSGFVQTPRGNAPGRNLWLQLQLTY